MNKHLTLALGLALLLPPATARAADPVVSNFTASQRAGTKLVDISCDVTADAPTVIISLEISSDGGTSFNVPATTVSGSIGAGVFVGTGKIITWDAGADWSGQYSAQMRFKVTATETLPDPTKFSLIPAGSFQMGDVLDHDLNSNGPVHTVDLSAFYLQQKGVTKAEWDAVRTWGLAHGYTDLAAGAGKAAGHPVQTVSWYDVVKWCNARSEHEGLTPCYYTDAEQTTVYQNGSNNLDNTMVKWTANGYRLPTEAEREKAGRGGLSGKRFPWGDTISHTLANYYVTTGYYYDISQTSAFHPTYGFGSGGPPYTSPVGSFVANGYGIYDMAGNVWEWCWDLYGPYSSEAQTDPLGASSGSARSARGGSWSNNAGNCRVANRNSHSMDGTYSDIGFRPVRISLPSGGTSFAESADVVVDTRANVALTTTAQHGTVTGAGDYAPGSTATLTATAAPGYAFTAWSGDASGAANPLSVLMNADKTITATFTPDTNDDDNDGLTNYQEIVEHGTDPNKEDTDEDGAKDKTDAFPLDPAETLDTDRDGIGDNADPDDDNDGYSDADEITLHHTNPKRADSDGDGLTDPAEIQTHHTNPNLADTDGDGLNDGPEVLTHHTNPLAGDTDGDGFLDGYEVLTGHAPITATDKPALVAEARTAIEFTFPAAVGKIYCIEASTDLATWEIVESGIAGTGAEIQRFFSTRGQPKRYFRVEEVAAP